MRINGRVIDISKTAHATYAGKDVVVKHLLSDAYRVFYGEGCIAGASEALNDNQPKQRQERRGSDIFTEQLGGDIFTLL